jgi:hypothetical protein
MLTISPHTGAGFKPRLSRSDQPLVGAFIALPTMVKRIAGTPLAEAPMMGSRAVFDHHCRQKIW